MIRAMKIINVEFIILTWGWTVMRLGGQGKPLREGAVSEKMKPTTGGFEGRAF